MISALANALPSQKLPIVVFAVSDANTKIQQQIRIDIDIGIELGYNLALFIDDLLVLFLLDRSRLIHSFNFLFSVSVAVSVSTIYFSY